MVKIMVIEDEVNLLSLYKDELEDEGYEVEAYSSGREGIERMSVFSPDIVVLDIKLDNGGGGLEVLREMKSRKENLKVILNSAYSTFKNDFTTWMADAYIVKSSDLKELKTQIKEFADKVNAK
jgi:DNA-binding response OmpR family regulator